MANDPLRRTPQRPIPPPSDRPKIWAEGQQRPPLSFRGLRRATLYLSREGVAPLNAWAARTARRVAENVANGAGRIPEGKLGRMERFVPSHLRVAGWIKNTAAVLAHASAVADTDVKRGNALVAEIEPHLWPVDGADAPAQPQATPPDMPATDVAEAGASPFGADAPPVEPAVLAEPSSPVLELAEPETPEADPLAAIRDDLDATTKAPRKGRVARPRSPSAPALPPDPPGPLATNVIQVVGYLLGWATVIVALPYGLARSLWIWLARYVDLRQVGRDS